MARCYIRVPTYVAAYIRNRDAENRIQPGGEVSFPEVSVVGWLICRGLRDNAEGAARGIESFSEKQFSDIKRICGGKENLSDTDVMDALGVHKKVKKKGEYLCVSLPRELDRMGVRYRITSTWFIKPAYVSAIVKALTQEFWNEFIAYMARDKEWAMANGQKRATLDGIERFLERYDIANDKSDIVKENMKRNYYRKLPDYAFTEYDYIEHGDDTK